VLKLLLKTLGWMLAHMPEPVLHALAVVAGDLIFFAPGSRRRLVLSNLHHAFPGRPRAWQHQVGRESCRRLVETALLSFATPFLSEARLRTIISASPGLLAAYAAQEAAPAATIFCSPHIAYWEAQTSMALVLPGALPEFGIIFRPLDNAAANAWVTRARERFGMRMLSRREGFAEALKILRRRGFVGVLFDQNAGMQGALTTLFSRVCSTTELPGLMAEKFAARVYGIFPRRRAFWRVEIDVQRVTSDGTAAGVTLALNRWLEAALAADDNLCASWLWIHNRWRNQDIPPKRLRLEARRDLLGADLRARNLPALPRKTRVWVRLPNWLGDVVMALPLLRALRVSRPDAEITLIAKDRFLPLLATWKVADRLLALPPRGGPGYFAYFWQLRQDYPDTYLLFTNSLRGDLEAWLTRCRQRFGIVRPGQGRPLLTQAYHLPADFNEQEHHQLELWENFLRHFGLHLAPDRSPLPSAIPPARHSPGEGGNPPSAIGLIPGSENNPEKRWPVLHWRALIEALPAERFVLFGTAQDVAIASAIAAGFEPARVENLAGRTDLLTYGERLRACRLLVTNDTGGMHLANALGVPLLALFGPTNPVRTSPVFTAPVRILQPPGCASTGGGALAALAPATVIAATQELLAARPDGV
jgi:heptosyltransferase II